MATSGAQPGNRNAVSKRPFWSAVNEVAKEMHGVEKIDAFKEIARQLLNAAIAGEQWAVREFADRADGKAIQQVDANITAQLEVVELRRYADGTSKAD